MNGIQSLIDRQLGIYCRLNYDNILKRLVVDGAESFYGLQSAGVVATFEQDPPIFACRFAEVAGREHLLALANEDGRVAIQDTTSTASARTLEGFQCHNNAVFDLAWMPGNMNFVTVSGDHTACLWDINDGSPRRVLVFSNHTRSVKTAVFRPSSPAVFATGARDGHILVWDVRASAQPAVVLKPDNCLLSCHSSFTPKTPGSHGKRARLDARTTSVTGLVFQDERTLLSCGECDGNIKAWDLRKNYSAYKREPLPKHSIPYCGSSTRNGYTNLVVDDARVRLYASCMDHVIYCFNVAAYGATPERRYQGHENATFYIKASLSPDCRYLVSGSSDKHAYVWNVQRSRPLLRLAGHRAEVTCAAWCRRGAPKLVTCSDDARHHLWRLGPEELPPGTQCAGRAEPAPAPPAEHAARRDTSPPGAAPAKRARLDRPRTKRCLADLMNAPDSDAAAKRARPDAPPPTLDDEARPLRLGVKRPISECLAERSSPEPRAGRSFVTPPKSSEAPRSPRSPPRAGERSPTVRIVAFGTPTKDLPNFVIDGEAPHLRLMSPVRRKLDRPNWLTQLGRDLRGKRGDAPERPAIEKFVDKLGAPSSPKENVPARRSSVSDRAPKPTKTPGTLLKYFNVTRDSCK